MKYFTFIAFLLASLGCAHAQSSELLQSTSIGVVPQILQTGQFPRQWVRLTLPQSSSYITQSVARAPDGNVWLTETGPGYNNGYVGYFRMDRTLEQFPANFPSAIVAGPTQAMWFVDVDKTLSLVTINTINNAGSITSYALPSGHIAADLCNGKDGNIWFTDYKANEVGKITQNGFITEYPVPTTQAFPLGCHLGPDRAIWFAEEQASQVGRIDEKTGAITEFTVAPAAPMQITLGSDGNLWFVSQKSLIGKITTAGKYTLYSPPKIVSLANCITLGPDNNIWFGASAGLGSVSPSGNFVWHYEPSFHTGDYATGIASGLDGNLWMAFRISTALPQVDVFIRRVITVTPASLTLNAGQQVTITVKETHYESKWTAKSSDTNVATVVPGSGRNYFTVTAVHSGTATITVSDDSENSFAVPVTVN